ncbi:Hypothetical predicted protein [Mytilus galloprovincialis]|nr:Hypothetical predicted protein [Mytilus galloprovincialis]
MVAIPDGFLVPFKTDGSISLVDIDGEGPYKLTDDQTGKWFYHRVVWKDMDLDGDLDILTCRAKEPVIGIGKDSEMLWLENPGNYYTPWRPTVIAHGPDIFAIDAVLNTTDGPRDCLIAAQFFTSSLTIYWVDNQIANWTDASRIKSRLPILLTQPPLFVFRSGDFKRHSIATGFKPGKSGTGKGAPGAAMPVYPNTKVNADHTWFICQLENSGFINKMMVPLCLCKTIAINPRRHLPNFWEENVDSDEKRWKTGNNMSNTLLSKYKRNWLN